MTIAQGYVKLSFVSIFVSSGPFLKNFGQVPVQIMLYFMKIKRIRFIVTCLIVFVFFWDQDWQGGVLKLNKNYKVFLPIWVLFP